MKTVCFFGIYDSEYSRNKVLRAGFEACGWSVVECRVDPKQYGGYAKYGQLKKLWQEMKIRPDLLLVAYPGQTVLKLARELFPKGTIVFDAFVSLYEANVEDRRLYSRFSLRGIRDFWLDQRVTKFADYVLLDTNEHIKYFCERFGHDWDRFIRVFVSSCMTAEKTAVKTDFTVHFHGTFIPLQGIEYILGAAKLLEDDTSITFNIMGDGQTYSAIHDLYTKLHLARVHMLPRLSFGELSKRVGEASVVLGIFGTSKKTARVIPNKVFEGLTLGKAIITGDTPAIRELLHDRSDVLLVKCGNARDLADKILEIKNNSELRRGLEVNAAKLYQEKLLPQKLVVDLLAKIAL